MQPIIWLGLGYNVPVNPSKNRVYVWRKLKEFGAGYFKQGVALLPNTPQSLTRFSALAARIRELGGEASIVELRFIEPRDEMEMVARFKKQSEVEYRELLQDCAGILTESRENRYAPSERSERLRKIVKRYGKVKSRDYFRSRSGDDIAGALDELASDMARVTDELGRSLRNILDL